MVESTVTFWQGTRGSGKTNAAMGELRTTAPLFAIAMRSNDWTWMGQRFYKFNDFVYWAATRGLKSSAKQMQISFQFGNQEDYILLLKAMAQSFQNCTIVVDEADALYSVPKFEQPLNDLFLGSRNNNLNLHYMSKRPFLVPVLIRSNVDRFVIFCTEEKRDVEYLSSRVRQQFPKDPFRLAIGEAIVMTKQGQQWVPVLHKFPKFGSVQQIPSTTTREEHSSSRKLITLQA